MKIVIPGDIDDSETIDLRDAILALQVSARIDPSSIVYKESDISGDGGIGIEEAVYVLQIVSDIRNQ